MVIVSRIKALASGYNRDRTIIQFKKAMIYRLSQLSTDACPADCVFAVGEYQYSTLKLIQDDELEEFKVNSYKEGFERDNPFWVHVLCEGM